MMPCIGPATQGMDQPTAGMGAAGIVAALLSMIDFSKPMSFDCGEKTR